MAKINKKPTTKILMVNGDKSGRNRLITTLEKTNFQIIKATSGTQAWEILKGKDAPEIAVLDWIMPGLSGIDLCKKIKSGKLSQFIYTIIIPDSNQKQAIDKAMDAGADDVIPKPFDPYELILRINTGDRIVQYENAINYKRNILSAVIDNIPQFIYWKGMGNKYLGCNQNFAKSAGMKHPKKIVGKSDIELGWLKEEEKLYEKPDLLVLNSKRARYHKIMPRVNPDGTQSWLDISRMPLRNRENEFLGVLVTLEDITERKKTDEKLGNFAAEMEELAEERAKQLTHSERMATLGLMASGIAHEINNPNAFISGSVQTMHMFWEQMQKWLKGLLESKDFSDKKKLKFIFEEMPKVLDGMLAGVGRISRITRGLATYSRKSAKDRVKCNINDCITMALYLCHNELKHHVIVQSDFAEDMPEIMASPQEIEQVFVNLFINASHATKKKGKGSLFVSTQSLDGNIIAVVQDDGNGIPRGKLTDIWKPFFTTKEIGLGTGLGLSISMNIIEDHFGTIHAENAKTGGARFVIKLPIGQ